MKIILSIYISLTCIGIALAQNISAIKQGETLEKVRQNAPFHFIHRTIDTTSLIFIGTFRASGNGNKSSIELLYNTIQSASKKNGANSFKLISVKRNQEQEYGELVLETYYSTEETIHRSEESKRKNLIYIFSGESKGDGKVSTFKINDVRKELENGKYMRLELAEGEEIKISKGGITGTTAWFTGKADKPATYLSLTGFGVGPGVGQPGTVGLSFNTGRIYPMDKNLGELLTYILERVEYH